MRWLAIALLCAGCTDQQASPNAGQVNSIILTLKQPADTGTPASPVTSLDTTFDLHAVDDQGQAITHDVDVTLFLSFGGVKTGAVGACGVDSGAVPIEQIHMPGGVLLNHSVTIPQAYGATTLWIDEPISGSTGASPTIYYRNPFVADVQTPPDINAANASFCTPFNGKFIIIDKPAMPSGQLVVSSVFGDSFVVTDTSYAGYDQFNSMYLYAFGKPPDYIVPGKVLNSFSGNVSKFVGFTELNFPLFDATDQTVPLATLPPPAVLMQADQANLAKLIALDAGVVTFTGKQCDIMTNLSSWQKYNQLVLDQDGTCSALTNFATELPSKVFGTWDPTTTANMMVTVTGMLRNNSGQNPVLDANNMPISCDPNTNPCAKGSCVEGQCLKGAFNFWTIDPRTPDDVVIQ
jgi:hypothetical protein